MEMNVPDPSWADEQAKMLIMPSNLLNAKNLADVSCAKYFIPSPSKKARKMSASVTTHGMGASKSLNRIVHFKTLNKSLGFDLCQLLGQVLSVTSVFKRNGKS